jgi:hypothetical protein
MLASRDAVRARDNSSGVTPTNRDTGSAPPSPRRSSEPEPLSFRQSAADRYNACRRRFSANRGSALNERVECAYPQIPHRTTRSCSRIPTRTARPLRSGLPLTSCSTSTSQGSTASMPPKCSVRCASTARRDRRRVMAAAGRRGPDTAISEVRALVIDGRGELEVRLDLRGSRRDQVEPFATVDPIDVEVAIKREDP